MIEEVWEKLVDELEKELNCTMIMLEEPFEDEDDIPECIDKDYLLSTQHVFLPKLIASTAWKINNRLDKFRMDWDGGSTSLGNAIWDHFMFPNLKRAEKFISEKKWKNAFAVMFGIHLSGASDEGWISSNEIYCDFPVFSGWFADYSKAWKTLLTKSDKQLGLDCKIRPGGYRDVVQDFLRKWEDETNELLEEIFDEFMKAGDIPARVRIFSEAEPNEGNNVDDKED